MVKMDLVSVIVPVYGTEPYLERCVESIRNQTYDKLEIILVDDGSPDRCGEICDEFQKADSRIKVLHKENSGQGLARNAGLDLATGDYVVFIDSDDWISHTHIETLWQAAQENQADVVIGAYTSVSGDCERQCPVRVEETVYRGAEVTGRLLLPLIGPDVHVQSDVQVESSSSMSLYSMAVIREHGLRFISEKLCIAEDMFFNIAFLRHASCAVVTNEFGYYYFDNQDSTSRHYDPQRLPRTYQFYEVLKQAVQDCGLAHGVDHRIERTYLMKIRVAMRHIVLSDLSRKEKLGQIRGVLENDITQNALHAYPLQTFAPAIRLLAQLMRRKHVLGVYCLIKFREAVKGQTAMRAVLKCVGIGR